MGEYSSIKTAYVTPNSPGSFGGIRRLYEVVKGKSKLKDVENWLKNQDTYSLFKQVRRNFPRLPILVNDIDEQWQIDLMDMTWLAKENNNYKYLLNVIDCFSRYAWVIPLKSKSATEVSDALETLFKMRTPQKLQSDQGKEFVNLCKKYKINFFTSTDDVIKCAIVERFNRTLRTRLYRYLHYYETKRYIDDLGEIVTSYNNSFHRTIQMSPSEVSKDNITRVLINIRKSHPKNKAKQNPFKVGDTVRIARAKGVFEKGTTSNFSEEIFTIIKVKKTPQGYIYRLKDYDKEKITSIFYHYELVKAEEKSLYKVEKVIKSRINPSTKKKEYFVKWLGYPSKFNSWVQDVVPT